MRPAHYAIHVVCLVQRTHKCVLEADTFSRQFAKCYRPERSYSDCFLLLSSLRNFILNTGIPNATTVAPAARAVITLKDQLPVCLYAAPVSRTKRHS